VHVRPLRRKGRTILLAALLILVLPAGAVGADPRAPRVAPDEGRSTRGAESKLTGPLSEAQGRQAAFVEFAKPAAADAYATALPKGRAAARDAARKARAAANTTSTAVVKEVRADDSRAREIYRTSNAVAGVAVFADADSLRELAARPDVVSISSLVPKRLSNASAAGLTRVLASWQDLGLFGDDMRVGVVEPGPAGSAL